MLTQNQVQVFIEQFSLNIEPIWEQLGIVQWNQITTQDPGLKKSILELKQAEHHLYEDPASWEFIQNAYTRRDGFNLDIQRQIEILYNMFALNQSTSEEHAVISRLEIEIKSLYMKRKVDVKGEALSEDDILNVLRHSLDDRKRQAVWTESKHIGIVTAESLRELAHARNAVARRLGFSNHYHLAVSCQEISMDFLNKFLSEIEDSIQDPFRKIKEIVDNRLAGKFGISKEDLSPWHYADPFFQHAPPVFDSNVDSLFGGKDVVNISVEHYNKININVVDILNKSDIHSNKSKSRYNATARIDRKGDVRILVHMSDTARSMSTIMHELGHAAYNKNISNSLPLLLRRTAHHNVSEGIAILMGRLIYSPDWLIHHAKCDADAVKRKAHEMLLEHMADLLIFFRWSQVMIKFKQAFYADPSSSDLNSLWWDLVEKYQGIRKPAGRDAPDWAAKYHMALAPIYYQNFAIGDVLATHLEAWLERETGAVFGQPEIGTLLKTRLFAHGARYPWEQLIETATGEGLNAQHYIDRVVSTIKKALDS